MTCLPLHRALPADEGWWWNSPQWGSCTTRTAHSWSPSVTAWSCRTFGRNKSSGMVTARGSTKCATPWQALLRAQAESLDVPGRGHAARCVPPPHASSTPVQTAEPSFCLTSPTPTAQNLCLHSTVSIVRKLLVKLRHDHCWGDWKLLSPCPAFPMGRPANIPVPCSTAGYSVKCTDLLPKHCHCFSFKLPLPRKCLFAAAWVKTILGVNRRGSSYQLRPNPWPSSTLSISGHQGRALGSPCRLCTGTTVTSHSKRRAKLLSTRVWASEFAGDRGNPKGPQNLVHPEPPSKLQPSLAGCDNKRRMGRGICTLTSPQTPSPTLKLKIKVSDEQAWAASYQWP